MRGRADKAMWQGNFRQHLCDPARSKEGATVRRRPLLATTKQDRVDLISSANLGAGSGHSEGVLFRFPISGA